MAAPAAPSITGPYAVSNFSTNKAEQRISGTAAVGTTSMSVSQRPDITVVFNSSTLVFYFDVVLTEGDNVFYVVGGNADGLSDPALITIILTSDDTLAVVADSPTGVLTGVTRDKIVVKWQGNDDADVLGYNVRRSDQPAGGVEGYDLLTLAPVTESTETVEERTQLTQDTTISGGVETIVTTNQISLVEFFTYDDSKILTGGGIDKDDYYYVVTALKYDAVARQEVESPFSGEVTGRVIPASQTINEMPGSTQREIVVRMVNSVFSAQPQLDVKTGQVARDLLDVMAEQQEDSWVVVDFMHRAQSFITLSDIDDADSDGVSDDPATSTYKQALKKALDLEEDSDVQAVIDSAFTKLASTFGVERIEASEAKVDLTFYVGSEPEADLVVNEGDQVVTVADREAGIPELTFRTLSTATLPFATRSNFFNFSQNRWEIVVPAICETAGVIGNVSAGTITSILAGAVGFSVTNQAEASRGEDSETNSDLADRTLLALIGVDTGSEAGYLRKTLEVAGVANAQVVVAGGDIMFRDYDEVREKHIGGKVDIYVQSDDLTQVTETIPVGNVVDQVAFPRIYSVPMMQFIVDDTVFDMPGNEIFQVTKVRNVTKGGQEYDLTGLTIIEPNAVDLDETKTLNLQIGLSSLDVVEVTFDRRNLEVHTLQNQPVEEVTDVQGALSGDLADNFNVWKRDDPLFKGRSNQAEDGVEVFHNDSNGKPTGDRHEISDESVVLVSETRVELAKVGVDSRTVVVTSSDGSEEFTAGIDYELEEDTSSVTSIYRLASGGILSGQTVLVSYEADENVQVTYTYNPTVADVAANIDLFKHATADVAVKRSVAVSIDISLTAVLTQGATRVEMDGLIRSVIHNQIAARGVGESVYQGDVIGWVEVIPGVEHVVVPLTTMVRADQNMINAEPLVISTIPSAPNSWQSLSGGDPSIWMTKLPVLTFATVDGGGLEYQPTGRSNTLYRYVAVYRNKQALTAVTTQTAVAGAANRCFIRSDGRIVISLPLADSVYVDDYDATYFVDGETGAKNIVVNNLEYPVLGAIVVNFGD